MPPDLSELLAAAVRKGASDLLLAPGAPPTVRVHGDLTPAGRGAEALGLDDAAYMLVPCLPEGRAERFRAGAAVDFCFDLSYSGRVRCNLHRTQAGISAAL